ncbi:pirin family protein [Sandaracinobacter sp.]|jgi:redox-sensitive bicupin YhaK (pirin superfamily)|uniref:pirin family protein n=1 Tax=Sandaracinobacter sp. TaxID=2487581 RepID=UPI0035B23454
MIEVRPFETLGAANHGWLDAHHHFSFAGYHEPARMGWGAIRVWNDDIIAPQSGFPPHPHKDMEIITYVRSGAITHEDSMGNRGRTEAGDVQVMSAGTGVRHAEYNLEDEETRIFQIWILPEALNAKPAWGARPFPKGDRAGAFVPLASGMGDDGALPIQTPARVLGATLKAGTATSYRFGPGRVGYLVPAEGRVRIDGKTVNARDGVAIRDVEELTIEALEDSELVLVDALK